MAPSLIGHIIMGLNGHGPSLIPQCIKNNITMKKRTYTAPVAESLLVEAAPLLAASPSEKPTHWPPEVDPDEEADDSEMM